MSQFNSFSLESSLTPGFHQGLVYSTAVAGFSISHFSADCIQFQNTVHFGLYLLVMLDAGYYMMLYVLSLRANINWEILLFKQF